MKRTILIATMSLLFLAGSSYGQDNVDTGLWSEATITKSLNKKTDLTVGARYETKANNSETQEWRVYASLAFKRGNFTLSPTYIFVESASKGTYYFEHRPSFNINYKLPVKSKVWAYSLGARNEFRIRPGKNDYRVVPTFSLEKKLNAKYKFFNREELWLDTRKHDPTQYRFRTFNGINRTFNKHLNVDLFFMYQHDSKGFPHNVYKFGMFWKFKL